MNAAESYDVSPYHLVSRVIQEVGSNGSRSVSGTEPGYEGIYNYYNIGAYQSSDPVINALKWASTPSSNENTCVLGTADIKRYSAGLNT